MPTGHDRDTSINTSLDLSKRNTHTVILVMLWVTRTHSTSVTSARLCSARTSRVALNALTPSASSAHALNHARSRNTTTPRWFEASKKSSRNWAWADRRLLLAPHRLEWRSGILIDASYFNGLWCLRIDIESSPLASRQRGDNLTVFQKRKHTKPARRTCRSFWLFMSSTNLDIIIHLFEAVACIARMALHFVAVVLSLSLYLPPTRSSINHLSPMSSTIALSSSNVDGIDAWHDGLHCRVVQGN